MSLVAYNSSDESDVNDDNDTGPKMPIGVDAISDDDEPSHSSSQQSAAIQSLISSPIQNKGLGRAVVDYETEVTETGESIHSRFEVDKESLVNLKGLPAPRAAADAIAKEEDELEELVKLKPAELLIAPKPPPKRHQPVKISIPSVEPDSDEEEEENQKPKPLPSGVKSGLFSLLPPPKLGSKKETNRPLIPHTLTKKVSTPLPQPPRPKHPATAAIHGGVKKSMPLQGLGEYSDSDAEENAEEVEEKNDIEADYTEEGPDVLKENFFSLDSPPPKRSRLNSVPDVVPTAAGTLISKGSEEDEAEIAKPPSLLSQQDAPLQFGRTAMLAGPASLSAYSSLNAYSPLLSGHSTLPAYHLPSAPYSQEEELSCTTSNVSEMEEVEPEVREDDNLGQFVKDEQFLRLQSKKTRGREDINIIDANMDDFVNSVDLVRNLTEETSYQSHRKSDNTPTHQQRRKKQITYLAFQAKERELELKNTWSQNKLTRKQTQSKYGF